MPSRAERRKVAKLARRLKSEAERTGQPVPSPDELARLREAALAWPEALRVEGFDPDAHMKMLAAYDGDQGRARNALLAARAQQNDAALRSVTAPDGTTRGDAWT